LDIDTVTLFGAMTTLIAVLVAHEFALERRVSRFERNLGERLTRLEEQITALVRRLEKHVTEF
jgi:cell division protein ZapA (FtsZ GTPase activity inhibitor)